MVATKEVEKEKKPTNPPKVTPKAGEAPIEDPVDYKLTVSDVVIRTKDGVYIPNDPNNPDRVAYEAWGMAGGVAYPADPPVSAATPTPPPPEAAPKTPEVAHKNAKEKEHRYSG